MQRNVFDGKNSFLLFVKRFIYDSLHHLNFALEIVGSNLCVLMKNDKLCPLPFGIFSNSGNFAMKRPDVQIALVCIMTK